MNLLDTCLNTTGRTYPAGYGFALAYLRAGDTAGPEHLKAMQAAAWSAVKRETLKGNPDGARFVQAYLDSCYAESNRDWPWWLIEAAQLVQAQAVRGNAKALNVMRMWGHPGFLA